MNKAQKWGIAVGLALAGRELWGRLREADLSGQLVLITGSSRGLGLAMARAFAAHGCRLALCARDADELSRAQEDLTQRGATVGTFVCDIRQSTEVEQLIAEVSVQMGQIDILVNNAGIIEVGPLANMSLADFENALATNFWGVLYPILAVLPQMRARRSGRIVNITSVGGKIGVPHLLPYSSAKFAATGFSEGLRAEAAQDGVTVTTIVPGLMRTGSFLNASFKGNHAGEYAWFSLGDNIPGLSMGAETAAKAIVQATRRGEAERILGLPARVATRVQGLVPGLVSDVSALINRALPAACPGSGDQIQTGAEVRAQHPSPARDTVTTLGFSAAERLNETSSSPPTNA